MQLCDSPCCYFKCMHYYMVFLIYTSFPDARCEKLDVCTYFFFLINSWKNSMRCECFTEQLHYHEVPSPGLNSHYLCSHKQNMQHVGGDFTRKKSAKLECQPEVDAVNCAKSQVSSKRNMYNTEFIGSYVCNYGSTEIPVSVTAPWRLTSVQPGGICSSFESTRKLKNICVSVLHFMTQECLSVCSVSQ